MSIVASNLDEFFMVRVAGLKRRIATGLAVPSAAGLSPEEQMEEIAERAHQLQARHADVFHNQVLPALEEQNIRIVGWTDLDADAKQRLRQDFMRDIFPILTPLAVDPAHPFPYISGLSLNLAVLVRNPQTGKELFAREGARISWTVWSLWMVRAPLILRAARAATLLWKTSLLST